MKKATRVLVTAAALLLCVFVAVLLLDKLPRPFSRLMPQPLTGGKVLYNQTMEEVSLTEEQLARLADLGGQATLRPQGAYGDVLPGELYHVYLWGEGESYLQMSVASTGETYVAIKKPVTSPFDEQKYLVEPSLVPFLEELF